MKKKTAFTLAETLIALVMIGVIAAMVIPILLQGIIQDQYRTALKKSISILSQAIAMHYVIDHTKVGDYQTVQELSEGLFQKRLNVMKVGAGNNYIGEGSAAYTIQTVDGISFAFKLENPSACDNDTIPCYTVYIDVNGDKKPNTLTTDTKKLKDGFTATLYDQKVVAGSAGDTATAELMYRETSDLSGRI